MSHRLSTRLSRPNLPAAGGITVGELLIEPDERDGITQRHIALCIDVSGSMAWEEKLEAARQGAKWTIGLLNENDSLSVVTFSADAQVELPATTMSDDNKDHARSVIENLSIRGGTNITAGLNRARETLEQFPPDDHASQRILLLSDGQDDGAFHQLAERVADIGVSIMAAGIGDDYDETVIRTLAERSQGQWRHLDDAGEIREFFDHTIEAAGTVVAANPTLTLDVTAGIEINEVYRGSPQVQPVEITWAENTAQLPIPDLNDGTPQKIVLEFKAPPREVGNEVLLAHATLQAGSDERTEQFSITYTDDPAQLAVNNEDIEVAFEGTKLRTEMIEADTRVEQEAIETKIHEMETLHPDMNEEVTRIENDHETIIQEGRAGKDSVSRVVDEDGR